MLVGFKVGLVDELLNHISIIQKDVKFVRDISSRAHFKGNFMLIKNWIGTMPQKCLVLLLKGGSYYL